MILAATARHAARKARELVQRKTCSPEGLAGKTGGLLLRARKSPELFLVEGDSAGGTAKQGDRNFQAILPLRVNPQCGKALEHKIYENEEIKNMFTALGVTIEENDDGERILNMENCATTRSSSCATPTWTAATS